MAIYLDNSATTRVRPEVLEAMLPYLGEHGGNPSSIHSSGRRAKEAVDKARRQVSVLLNCQPDEVYFSPCGTVSNNVALLGRARFAEANGFGRHLVTTLIEHPAVLGPAKYLESRGWKVTFLPVDSQGIVRTEDFQAALTPETSIASVMWANNEIGTVEPVEEFVRICNEREIFFHTDAVQVPGKLPIDMAQVRANSLALSGHKFFAPKGIGILFVRKLSNLMPIVFGGGQEMGLMPGTESVASIVAIGEAAEIAHAKLLETQEHLRKLQEILWTKLRVVPDVKLTGAADISLRLPGHVSLILPDAKGESMVLNADIKGVCVSSGSACHNGIIEPSQVLKAIGLSNNEALGSLRISAGALTTEEDCTSGAEILSQILSTTKRQQSKTVR